MVGQGKWEGEGLDGAKVSQCRCKEQTDGGSKSGVGEVGKKNITDHLLRFFFCFYEEEDEKEEGEKDEEDDA